MGKWPLPSLVVIHWISVKSAIEAGPDLPHPLSLTPPSGSCGSSAMVWSLTCTTPASMRRASAKPRWLSPVMTPALSPYLVEFAIATASSASATGWATSTGPNVSSVWMRAPAGTSARTVGR